MRLYGDHSDGRSVGTGQNASRDVSERPPMSHTVSDRNLLYGILALQVDLIDRDTLIESLNQWAIDKGRTLGSILIEHQAITSDQDLLLDGLVAEHLKKHEGDLSQSLAGLEISSAVEQELASIVDTGLQQSVTLIANRLQGDRGAPKTDRFHAESTLARDRRGSKPDEQADTLVRSIGQSTSDGLRFQILRPHAEGGLGQVFVARDTEVNRQVALKEIKSRFANDTSCRQRFNMEAEITGGLEHPGIVPVYGLGSYRDGRPFYAMRFIRGESLHDAVRDFHESKQGNAKSAGTQSLEMRQLLGRFVDVCNAIAYAHSRGVLHRDLKPANIMLGQYGETLVVDWGLAKSVENDGEVSTLDQEPRLVPNAQNDSVETRMGEVIGTPAFMSPEQAEGRLDLLNTQSDVYSLGATLYFVLTGDVPFRQGSISALLKRVANGEFESPRSLDPEIPRGLEAICLKAMSRLPEARYDSAQKMAADVESWLADEPISAWTEPFYVRAKRWVRRNQTSVTGLVAASVVAIVSLAIGLTIVSGQKQVLARTNATLSKTQTSLEKTNRLLEDEKSNLADANHDLKETTDELQETNSLLEKEKTDLADANRIILKRNDEIASKNALLEATNAELVVARKNAEQREAEAETARDLADASRIEAEEALKKAESVTKYLVEVFRSPDPERDGRSITVAELLDQAVETLPQELKDEDELRAELLEAIGETYRGLGLFPKSVTAHRAARDIRLDLFGERHVDTLTSMHNLALALTEAGNLESALTVAQRTLRRREQLLGKEHPHTLITKGNLALVHAELGDHELAVQIADEVLEARTRILGDDDPATLSSVNALAEILMLKGKYDEARELIRRLVATRLESLGARHPSTLTSQQTYANVLSQSGALSEALELQSEIVKTRTEVLGPDHPRTLSSRSNLALLFGRLGRHEEAIEIEEVVVETSKESLGLTNPRTLIALNNLALSYARMHRLDEAIVLLNEVIELYQKAYPENHPKTLTAMTNLAAIHFLTGDYHKGVAVLKDLEPRQAVANGDLHPLTLTTRHLLASTLFDIGQRDESIKRLERVLEDRKQVLGDKHPDTAMTQSRLGLAYLDVGQKEMAEKMLSENLKIREATIGPDHPETYTAKLNLAAVYLATERAETALPIYLDVLEFRRRIDGPTHPNTIFALNGVARSYLGSKQYAQAIETFRETIELSQEVNGVDHPVTMLYMNNYGIALRKAGKESEAAKVLQETYELRKTKFGVKHPQTKLTRDELLRSLTATGATDEVIAIFESLFSEYFVVADWDGEDIDGIALQLAGRYVLASRFDEALPLLRKMAAYESSRPEPSWQTLNTIYGLLGFALVETKAYEEAEPVLRACVELRETYLSESWVRFNAMSMLGEVISEQGRHRDAEPYLVDGYQGMLSRAVAIPASIRATRLDQALDRIVKMYRESGQDDQVEKWQMEKQR